MVARSLFASPYLDQARVALGFPWVVQPLRIGDGNKAASGSIANVRRVAIFSIWLPANWA